MASVFTKAVSLSGKLIATVVFETESDMLAWLQKDFLLLKDTHKFLKYRVYDLPGLKVGDTCRVHGEGADEFVITKLIKFSPHNYGFDLRYSSALGPGWVEPVHKCY
jgi:hypothetical protein